MHPTVKEALRPLVRALLEEELPGVFGALAAGPTIQVLPKGKRFASKAGSPIGKVVRARRGRPRQLSDEERKRRAAAYQRLYRARKKKQTAAE